LKSRHSDNNHVAWKQNDQQYPGIIGNASGGAWLVARALCFQINEKLMFIGK
jgi:hypothetical protein